MTSQYYQMLIPIVKTTRDLSYGELACLLESEISKIVRITTRENLNRPGLITFDNRAPVFRHTPTLSCNLFG